MFVAANLSSNGSTDKLFCFKILYATNSETLVKKIDIRKSEGLCSLSVKNSRVRACDGKTELIDVLSLDFKYLRSQDVPEGFSGNLRICQDDAEGNLLVVDREKNKFFLVTSAGDVIDVNTDVQLDGPTDACLIDGKLFVYCAGAKKLFKFS